MTIRTRNIEDSAVTAAKIATGAVTAAKVASNALDGTVAANVANVNVIGGIPVIHRVTAVAASDVDVVLTHKTRVVDVVVVATASQASGTITVKNSTTAITDAIVCATDTNVTRAGTINDASYEIAAAGTLRVTAAGAATAAQVYVYGFRVA